mmetsp:Transcript_7330/g.12315  ORF Transcript_7330/g.12315 Transcript_7330/m.12315 type:complete len:623 (+) Transcript_7330:67-1935(+)
MALHVQNQIRNNAEEVNGFFQDMAKWEKDIKVKDKKIIQKKLTKKARSSVPEPVTRAGAGTVAVTSTGTPSDKSASAAKHTYDVGYKKWEKVKITESDELEEDDEEDVTKPQSSSAPMSESTLLTPASLATMAHAPVSAQTQVPRPRGKASNVDIETYERERGNGEFKNGNFANAVKCYTKCLGLKPKNYIAFSNRAMAYLKLKEHHKAETDCSCALRIAPDHVKSLLRRASARSQLGKYRAALSDLEAAVALDPANKQVHQERKKAQDSLKSATAKAPGELMTTMWETDYLQQLADKQAEQELGALDSRVEELDDEEQEPPKQKTEDAFALTAGPELPLPTAKGGELQRGVIDMTQLAEVVEQELEQEQEQEEHASLASSNIKEANDGEWVVLTSPEKKSSSTRMQIVEDDDDEEEEEEQSGGDTSPEQRAVTEERKVPVVKEEVKKAVQSASSKKSEGSSSAKKSASKKQKSKKSSKKSSTASSSGVALYSIERQLLSCKGNDKLLLEFLNSIDEKTFLAPPSKSKGGSATQVLEVDVVVDLLLSVGKCFGEQQQQWARVLLWFEGVAARSGSTSFSFVVSMLSAQQKEALVSIVDSVDAHEGQSCRERTASVRQVYGFT